MLDGRVADRRPAVLDTRQDRRQTTATTPATDRHASVKKLTLLPPYPTLPPHTPYSRTLRSTTISALRINVSKHDGLSRAVGRAEASLLNSLLTKGLPVRGQNIHTHT